MKLLLTLALATAAAPAYAVMPGGLVAHSARTTGSATTAEVTMTVEAAPPDSSSYFWAQQFFTDRDHGGYFGLQTGGVINNRNVGKIAIFSLWNAVDAEAGPRSRAERFGGEGVGWSVRMPFQWVQGVSYRFRLEKDGPQWWRLLLLDPAAGTHDIGRIKLPVDAPLQPVFAAFTEVFRAAPSCEAVPAARTVFSDLTYGGAPVPLELPVPYGNCRTEAAGSLRGGAAVHEVQPSGPSQTTPPPPAAPKPAKPYAPPPEDAPPAEPNIDQ